MSSYGFVYLWHDIKHKRFYIGCRWGNENDGYICSSSWMKASYKKRPHDFRRRILSRVYTNKHDLLDEEYYWLSMTKVEELCGVRYYNMHNYRFNHWTSLPDEERIKGIGQKISAKNKGRVAPNKGTKASETTKQKIREANAKQFSDPKQREIRREKTKALWQDPEYRKRQTQNKKGVKQSAETLARRQQTIKDRGIKMGFDKGSIPWNKGITNAAMSRKRWWNNGNINKRSEICPGPGFVLGRY